jgi:hypothetical protein
MVSRSHSQVLDKFSQTWLRPGAATSTSLSRADEDEELGMFLNVDELIAETKRYERIHLQTFRDVLRSIHGMIKTRNQRRIKWLEYDLPLQMFGRPQYDVTVLGNYVIHHLKDNGLFVERVSPDGRRLYISWDEAKLNMEQYINCKERHVRKLEKRYSTQVALEVCTGNDGVMPQGVRVKKKDLEEARSSYLGLMDMRKKQQQRVHEERELRLQYQTYRSKFLGDGGTCMSFDEFIHSGLAQTEPNMRDMLPI